MSGRTPTQLLVLCLPALLPATCNPKRTPPDPAADTTSFAAGDTSAGAAEPGTMEESPGCDRALAAAPPAGPVLGPACPGDRPAADPAIAKEIARRAQDLAAGMAPVGEPVGGTVGCTPRVLASAVLRGPPHCYVIVALCDDDAPATIHVTATAAGETITSGGPAARVCPPTTGSFEVALSVESGTRACAARIFGD